jgi:hypothetical protein
MSMILKLLATRSLSMLLSACYGSIQAMYGVFATLRRGIHVRKADSTPLPQIKVSYTATEAGLPESNDWYDLGRTDARGTLAYRVVADPPDSLKVRLVDDDGPAKGGAFMEKTLVVDEVDEIGTLDEAKP